MREQRKRSGLPSLQPLRASAACHPSPLITAASLSSPAGFSVFHFFAALEFLSCIVYVLLIRTSWGIAKASSRRSRAEHDRRSSMHSVIVSWPQPHHKEHVPHPNRQPTPSYRPESENGPLSIPWFVPSCAGDDLTTNNVSINDETEIKGCPTNARHRTTTPFTQISLA